MPFSDYLSLAEVTEFRALIEDSFPDLYEVLDTVRTDTDEGGGTTTVVVTSTGVCRLRPVGESALERQIVQRLQWQVSYSVDLPYVVALTPEDRIRVNGTRTLEVGGVVKAGRWGIWATAICREVGS